MNRCEVDRETDRSNPKSTSHQGDGGNRVQLRDQPRVNGKFRERWTDAMDAKLRRRCAEKWSTREMSEMFERELGRELSRNAVIGRMHRLGITNGRPPGGYEWDRPRIDKSPKPPKRKHRRTDQVQLKPPAAVSRTGTFPTKHEVHCAVVDPRNHIGMLDWREGQCHWPMGEVSQTAPFLTYCGGQVAHKDCPYCETHRRMSERGYQAEAAA